jgi:hypothetical protein
LRRAGATIDSGAPLALHRSLLLAARIGSRAPIISRSARVRSMVASFTHG